jgi:hypothetical protein
LKSDEADCGYEDGTRHDPRPGATQAKTIYCEAPYERAGNETYDGDREVRSFE